MLAGTLVVPACRVKQKMVENKQKRAKVAVKYVFGLYKRIFKCYVRSSKKNKMEENVNGRKF